MVVGKNKPINKYDFFDYDDGYDDDTLLHIREDISEWHQEEAIRYYALFKELWGLVLITGERGEGKDLLLNYLAWVLYHAYEKKLLRSEKPRELFGFYDGLFNEEVLSSQIVKMNAEVKNIKTVSEKDELLSRIADEWIMSSEGIGLLGDSILAITEYQELVPKREPHKPINKTMGSLNRHLRHLPSLVIGTAQIVSDCDRYTCHPFINWEIRATRSEKNRTGFLYLVYKCKYHQRTGLTISNFPIDVIKLDGAKPITDLGMPITIVDDGYVGSKVETKVLDAIRSGITTYEDLISEVRFRARDQASVLSVLKYMFLHKPKIVNYGCWYNIYNSRSKVKINGSSRIATSVLNNGE